jgi:acyl carrier protein
VITLDDFLLLVRDEVGVPVTAENAALAFDSLPGWDSLHLLTLVAALERETGRPMPLPDVLEAGSLRHVYELAVA